MILHQRLGRQTDVDGSVFEVRQYWCLRVHLVNGIANEDEIAHTRRKLREPDGELNQVVTPVAEHCSSDVAVAKRLAQSMTHVVQVFDAHVAAHRRALDDLLDGVVLTAHHQLTAVVGERGDEKHAHNAALKAQTACDEVHDLNEYVI